MRAGHLHTCAVAAAALALAGGCNSNERERAKPAPTPAPPSAPVTVRVQADVPVAQPASMNGFIHSLDGARPPDAMVAPLKPRLWRSDLLRAPVERARALGAEYEFVLSDLWGYPPTGWAGRGPPWADLGKWERFVRRLARGNADMPIAWDIWNEPNNPAFWEGGAKRFFRVYAVANRVLNEELGPDVVIGGPSTSRYSPKWFTAFFESCVSAGCEIDFLAWHENLRPEDQLASISEHLADGRSRFLEEPRFAALGLRQIQVNEYIGLEDRYLPGETVAYLAQLERGGADLAARSCWSDEECSPPSLDGLLALDGSPRGTWWAHRWYADGLVGRVASESTDPGRVAVLANAPAAGGLSVLLGHTTQRPVSHRDSRASAGITLELSGLPTEGRVEVTIEKVPAVGVEPVTKPQLLSKGSTTVQGGFGLLALPALEPHEAMLVTLEPAG